MREPFNNVCGAGITMTNLFAGWPKEKIASIYWTELQAENGVCEKYYALNEQEMRWRFPFSGMPSLKNKQEKKQLPQQSDDANNPSLLKQILKTIIKKSWRYLNRWIGGLGFMITTNISNDLSNWIQTFQPDVIYCVPTDLASISFVEKVAYLTGASIVIHIYDDWPSIVGSGGILEVFYKKVITKAFLRLLQRCFYRYAICEEMAVEYKKRYDMEFLSFHNCPEPLIWLKKVRSANKTKSKFVFRFIGEMYLGGNLNVLQELSLSIASLQKTGMDVVLEIFTNDRSANEFSKNFNVKNIISIKKVPEGSHEVASLYAGADGLIMAYDFDDYSASRFRFSMPTKFPTYLLSGTPILLYAPKSLAITQRAISQEIAYVIDHHISVEQLTDHLAAFINDKQLRFHTARNGQKYALDHLIADVMRSRFHKVMSNVPNINI